MKRGIASVLAISCASLAWGHGPQIQVDVIDNRIVTRGVANDTADYTVLQPLTRAYSVNMVDVIGAWVSDYNTDEHTGPGFVILQNRFGEGTQLRFNILDQLKLWTGAEFAATTPEELQLSRSSGTVVANTSDAFPVTGFDIIASVTNATAGQHREIRYMLLGDGTNPLAASDNGVYLLKLELVNVTSSGAATGIAASLPFWMTFNKNIDAGTAAAAYNYVQTTLVPEPASLGVLGLAMLWSLRRRPGRLALNPTER